VPGALTPKEIGTAMQDAIPGLSAEVSGLMHLATNAAAFTVALVSMEGVAMAAHKHVMHGWLWCLHKSHHEQRRGIFEWNDLFAVFFSIPSIALVWFGYAQGLSPVLWAGWGIAGYGLVYFLIHDVFVHKRIKHNYLPRKGFLRRVLHAHRLHHATRCKHGAVSFGFVYAPPATALRAKMKAM